MADDSQPKKSLAEELEDLQREMIATALRRIRSEDATPADVARALEILKHNGIQVRRMAEPKLNELEDQLKSLPFPTGTDDA
jgi:hypothetical protein